MIYIVSHTADKYTRKRSEFKSASYTLVSDDEAINSFNDIN